MAPVNPETKNPRTLKAKNKGRKAHHCPGEDGPVGSGKDTIPPVKLNDSSSPASRNSPSYHFSDLLSNEHMLTANLCREGATNLEANHTAGHISGIAKGMTK